MIKKAILLVSFGVSFNDTREKTIDVIEQEVRSAYPDHIVRIAFTSEMIRRILDKRGEPVPNTKLALEQLVAEGVEEVYIQPTHLIAGDEYHKMMRQIRPFKTSFKRVRIGKPLMFEPDDYQRLAAILDEAYPRAEGEALVMMGHGTTHEINASYPALSYEFMRMGIKNVFIGTIEGYPELDVLLSMAEEGRFKKIRLAPLLLVAGDHARNDMAGDEEDSWKSQLTAEGYEVEPIVQGLGELPAIRQMYMDHLAAIM